MNDISTPDYVLRAQARALAKAREIEQQNADDGFDLDDIDLDDIDLDDIDLDDTREADEQVTSVNAATDKQINFARSLYREIRDLGADEGVLSAFAESVEASKDSKSDMSKMIDSLIKARDGHREKANGEIPEGVHVNADGRRIEVKRSRAGHLYALDLDATGDQYLGKRGLSGLSADTLDTATATPERDFPSVPDGRYALDSGNGVVKFYKVRTPSEGQWEGFTFLDVQASDDLHPIKNAATKRDILTKIAADPEAAAILYGIELGVCGRCGRTLTDETSRAAGIGPVCAEKGW